MLTRRSFSTVGAGAAAAVLYAPSLIRAQSLDVVRFCWAGTVIVAGQVQYTLKNTDIATKHGIKLESIKFVPGPSVTEALVSDAGDVGSMSDFNSVSLMAANAPLETFALESNFRAALLVSTKSGIEKVADLKGKSIYGLFGITAYQNAQQAVKEAGLTPGKDVNFVNLGVAELADGVRSGRIDAFFTWDPWAAMFEAAGLAKTLSQRSDPSMVLVSPRKFAKERPDVLKRFLRAHSEALFFASQNHELTNKWYRATEPGKSIPEDVIERASLFDPNWSAKNLADIKKAISPKNIANMESMAAWAYSEKLLSKAVDVKGLINTSIAQSADTESANTKFNLADVKITNPT